MHIGLAISSGAYTVYEVAHVTRDSDNTSKVKKSKVKVTGLRTQRGLNA